MFYYSEAKIMRFLKFVFRISIAILSGISTYFAFPLILALVSRDIFIKYFPQWFFLVLFACIALPFLIYYALTCRDTNEIHMSKNIKVVIVFTASLPIAIWIVFVGASFKGPMSLLLWTIALLLNLFFFSTVALSSLYYLLRTALAVERQQAAKDNLP
jgi:hypothetical protein